MGFLVIGKGFFDKEQLIDQLKRWGIENPLIVLKEAERGRTTCGQHKIFAVR